MTCTEKKTRRMADVPPKWLAKPPRKNPGQGRFLITSNRYPFYYLQITKCGCTFLRNLIYTLDHGEQHEDSARIHAHDDEFIKATLVPIWLLKKSNFMFTVVRDPVDRFLSLYFDKIADTTNTYDKAMRRRLIINAELDVSPDTDLAGHQENCLRTLAWVKKNLAGNTPGKIDPHWRHQSTRIDKAKGLPMKYLTLEGLSWQLPVLLAPLIPNIASVMAQVKSRNISKKLFTKDQIVTVDLIAAVRDIYPEDATMYQAVADDWGQQPEALA